MIFEISIITSDTSTRPLTTDSQNDNSQSDHIKKRQKGAKYSPSWGLIKMKDQSKNLGIVMVKTCDFISVPRKKMNLLRMKINVLRTTM